LRQALFIDRARSNRRRATAAEAIVWRWLRDRRLEGIKFRRQHPLGNYIADFYCHELRLVVELDGDGHELTYEYDEERTRILGTKGIAVIRICNEEVRRNPIDCGEAIVAAILRIKRGK
jgi:very-short-patch-repair endonuclease